MPLWRARAALWLRQRPQPVPAGHLFVLRHDQRPVRIRGELRPAGVLLRGDGLPRGAARRRLLPSSPGLWSPTTCLSERAKQFDLLLVPGSGFGTPGHFRLAYCVQTDMIRRALPKFRALAESYR